LLNLKPIDIDSKRKLLLIRQSKGKKDRLTPFSEKLIELLRDYYKSYRPKEWMFEGQEKGSQYTATIAVTHK
jgi:integrase/recombinase XerD